MVLNILGWRRIFYIHENNWGVDTGGAEGASAPPPSFIVQGGF